MDGGNRVNGDGFTVTYYLIRTSTVRLKVGWNGRSPVASLDVDVTPCQDREIDRCMYVAFILGIAFLRCDIWLQAS